MATGGSFSPAAFHSAQNLDADDTCIWPGCHDIGTFDHIVWTCHCRPCNMDIPSRPGEVLVARFGWVISRSVADMDTTSTPQSSLLHMSTCPADIHETGTSSGVLATNKI